uniref:Uncharacterized protein n=1 Tax=Cacopsylla melanoneura TaxID=428564 RepID=A0A8D9BHT2_9HEMI
MISYRRIGLVSKSSRNTLKPLIHSFIHSPVSLFSQEDRSRVEIFKEYSQTKREPVCSQFLNLLNGSDGFIINSDTPCMLFISEKYQLPICIGTYILILIAEEMNEHDDI